MKTKLYFTAIMLLGFIGVSNAQAQNQECMTNLSIYVEHAKVKNYEAAYAPWKMVYDNCPDVNWANFAYGERILKDKIKKSSGADKDANIQDLLALFDNSRKYFPKKATLSSVLIDQVLLKYDNKMIANDEIYSSFSKGFIEDRTNFKNPKALYLYFSSLVDLHKAGSKELQEVFDVYDDVTEKIEEENIKLTDRISQLLPKEEAGTLTSKEKKQLKASTTNSESFGKIAGSIDTKLGDLADCGNLVPLYQKSFEGKLQTVALTGVLLPVSDEVNDKFGERDNLNLAAKLYVLLFDTDIDLIFLTGDSRSTSYGFDLSKNLAARLWRQPVLDRAAFIAHFLQV